jgi:hypothetical protein
MRDRLIELFKKTDYNIFPDSTVSANLANQFSEYALNDIVDKLLENGVIVLPFSIGDTLYDISEFIEKRRCPEMYELKDDCISIRKERNGEYFFSYDYIEIFPDEIGKTVFLTKEEAEQALKGGAE